MDALSLLIAKKIGSGGGSPVPEYEGAYTVTPSESTQTLATKDKKATDDITVNPISPTYIGSGVTQKAAATYTPTTSDQTIAADQYLAGAQTVKGDANLVAGNIKKDVQMFGVTGTYEGGGSTPTGTINISENGVYNVTDYASANVSVDGGGGEEYPRYFMLGLPSSSYSTAVTYNVDFISNGQTFDQIRVTYVSGARISKLIYSSNGVDTIVGEATRANPYNNITNDKYKELIITGGTDAENANLLSHLVRIDVWTEPATYDPDTMYFYLDVPFDGFFLQFYSSNNSMIIKMNAGYGSDFSVNLGGGASYLFKGKYIASIKCVNRDLQTYYNGSYYSMFHDALSQSAIKKIRFASNGSLFENGAVGSYGSEVYAFKDFANTTIFENLNVYGNYALVNCAIEKANLVLGSDSIGTQAFYGCQNLREVTIPSGITSIGSGAFSACVNIAKFRFEPTTPPTVANSDAWTGIPTTCVFEIPYDSVAYLSATNYPSPSSYTYLGYGTFADQAALPSQDTTQAYNLTWYATKEDAIAQTNAITVGNGNEIYCRYTAV